MKLFFEHLIQFSFLQHAVLAGILASVACGITGCLIVARRSTYVAGAIAHCVLGGMGAARYMQVVHGWEWFTPLLGAIAAAVLSAFVISFITLSGRQREDTVLSAIWAIGMAVGIVFISATPGYYEDLMSYLFGNILLVSPGDLWSIGILNAVVLLITLLFFNKFLLISFHPELARLKGVSVPLFHITINVMISVSVVILTQVVGLIMVIALLVLPAATALNLTSRLWKAMVLSSVLSAVITTGGIAFSYDPEYPAGATIIIMAGLLYFLSLSLKALYMRFGTRIKH